MKEHIHEARLPQEVGGRVLALCLKCRKLIEVDEKSAPEATR